MNIQEKSYFLLLINVTNEGDGDFWNGDDYNYDIDLSYFDDADRKLYQAFHSKTSGLDLDNSEVYYGAGRNG